MPQTQGPVVIQTQRPVGALGLFGSQLLNNLGAGLGQAAGGFLGDLINPDPRKDLISAQAADMQTAHDNALLAGYEEYSNARGKSSKDPEAAANYFRTVGKVDDEDRLKGLVTLATNPTMVNKDMAITGDAMDVLRTEDNTTKPFSATPAVGPYAGTPPPPTPGKPEAKKEEAVAPVSEAPVTASAIRATGGEPAAPAPLAQAEQATNDLISVAPQVVVDTTKEVTPEVAPDSLPPAPKPVALSDDAKVTAMRKLQQVKGRLAMLGQMNVAQKTGIIDPAQSARAMADIATTDRDIADVINIGLIADGRDPVTIGNKNYRQMAFYGMARQMVNNPAWVKQATPEQIEQYRGFAKQYENAYMNSPEWTSKDWEHVEALSTKLLPQAVGNGGILNFMTTQAAIESREKESEADRAARASEFDRDHELKSRQVTIQEQKFAQESQLFPEQLRALRLTTDEMQSMQGTKLQEFQMNMRRAQQDMENLNKAQHLQLDAGSLSNLAALQGLADTSINQAIQITGLEINDQQRRYVSAQSALDRASQGQDKLTQAWNNSTTGQLAFSGVQAYQNKPSKYAHDYNALPSEQKAEVDALAVRLAGSKEPNSIIKAQALVARSQPGYKDYLLKYSSYSQQINSFSQQMVDMAQNNESVGDRIKALSTQLGGANQASIKAQQQELMGTFLNAKVLQKQNEIARAGVRGVSTEQGREFIKNNPTLIPYMLGQATVADGRINTKGFASVLDPKEVASLYGLARGARGADGSVLKPEDFGKIPVLVNGKSVLLRDQLGKKFQAAYNTYTTFATGGF